MNRSFLSWCIRSGLEKRFFSYKPIKRPSIIKESSSVTNDPRTNDLNLAVVLAARIKAAGPITVADYMRNVLTNPSGGYYMEKDVFGREGDFITSPEIGQIFGELVAVWCLTEWQKCGSPSPVQLVEFGPGRGTLSKDVLRVFAHFHLGDQFSLHLIEVSPHLSNIQAQRLCFKHSEVDPNSNVPYYRVGETISGAKVFWYRKLENVPNGFSIVVAHEFFDALPIHKLQKDKNIWSEILIDIDQSQENKFRFVISKNQTPISKLFRPIEEEKRDCLEYSIESDSIIENLSHRFESDGGFALIVDYGHFGDKTDTFRGFKNHKLHDPLLEPGTADITADVDFRRLKSTAENCGSLTFGPVEQGDFLKQMQGDVRLKVLLENSTPENQEIIKSGYDTLTHPDKMGKRFKCFSIFPQVLRDHLKKFPVAGFDS